MERTVWLGLQELHAAHKRRSRLLKQRTRSNSVLFDADVALIFLSSSIFISYRQCYNSFFGSMNAATLSFSLRYCFLLWFPLGWEGRGGIWRWPSGRNCSNTPSTSCRSSKSAVDPQPRVRAVIIASCFLSPAFPCATPAHFAPPQPRCGARPVWPSAAPPILGRVRSGPSREPSRG
jgi:hypothetical protein